MNILQKIGAALVAAGKYGETELADLWKDAEPWLVDLGTEVKADVMPVLTTMAAEAIAEVGTAIGGPGTVDERADALGAAVKSTFLKGVNAGLAVTEQDAATAFASASASVAKGPAAANQAVVAQVAAVVANTAAAGAADSTAADPA